MHTFIITAFSVYTVMLIAAVLSSWFPDIQEFSIVQLVRACTDPYLNLFRRIIPPIGGALDISPIAAFFLLDLIRTLLIKLF